MMKAKIEKGGKILHGNGVVNLWHDESEAHSVLFHGPP